MYRLVPFIFEIKNKQDLFQNIERLPYQHMEENLLRQEMPAIDKLEAYVRRWMSMLEGCSVNFTRNWLHYASVPPAGEDAQNSSNKIYYDIAALRRILEAGTSSGEFSPDLNVDAAATGIASPLYGTTLRYCSVNASFSLEEWADDVATLVRNIVLPHA